MRFLVKQIIYFLSYLFHRNHDSKVIYYHDAGRKYTDMGTEMKLMSRHFEIVRRSGYMFVPTVTLPEKEVMVCFDDGWKGIYDNKDFFVSQGVFPTVFIAVSLIGKEGYLSVEQIKELESMGFRFECHAWSHYDLTTFSDEELEHELKESKEWLEKTFNHPFCDICYPQGRFSSKVHAFCKQFGYGRQFSSICGGYFELKDKELVCRNCAQYSSPLEFKWMLNSSSTYFRRRFTKLHFQP